MNVMLVAVALTTSTDLAMRAVLGECYDVRRRRPHIRLSNSQSLMKGDRISARGNMSTIEMTMYQYRYSITTSRFAS